MKFIKKSIIIIFSILSIISILGIFKIQDKDTFQAWDSFYNEKKDSIDIIYVGASNVYPFWSAPLYWKESGHTVFPLSISSMPARAIKYMIEEARKTQPNAKFVVALNTFKSGYRKEPASIHYVCDYMKFSKNKVDLINALVSDAGISGFDKIEFYLPFVRFHSRWSSLSKKDYILQNQEIKNAISTSNSLNEVQDVSQTYRLTSGRVDCNDQQMEILKELLDYCDDKDIKLLFTVVPQAINDESIIAQMNMMGDYIVSRGHKVIDLLSNYNEYGLQLNQDFYNSNHINVHGALKFTRYFGSILDDYYNLDDKRNNDIYESWNIAYDKYVDLIDEHVLDFEINGAKRDYSLDIPSISNCAPYVKGILIKWNKVDKADGYFIYRKVKNNSSGKISHWTMIGKTSELSYQDKDAVSISTSWYTVVPYREEYGEVVYGNYDYNGKSTSYNIDAPELDSLLCDTKGNTISWNTVKGATGYKVYRQINGQRWIQIADINAKTKVLEYTDDSFQKDLPYLYSVSAYFYDSEGNIRESNIDRQGLLYLEHDLNVPALTVESSENDKPLLKWSIVKGANYYAIYRKKPDGDWLLLKDNIKQSTTSYQDDDIDFKYNELEYKLSAILKYGDNKYEYESNTVIVYSKEN